MNIKEMQELKTKTESEIIKILNTFEKSTNVEIFDIDFERVLVFGDRSPITNFTLDVRL